MLSTQQECPLGRPDGRAKYTELSLEAAFFQSHYYN